MPEHFAALRTEQAPVRGRQRRLAAHRLARFMRAPGGAPREWLRGACGAGLGLAVTLLLLGHLFGAEVALRLLGPLGATAILLFMVPSGAFSQPWPTLGGYLCGLLVSLAVAHYLGQSPPALGVALSGSVLLMCMLRCLHPPAGALALCLTLAAPGAGLSVLVLVASGAGSLLVCALLFNNLTGTRYPRRAPAKQAPAPASEPARRGGITHEDLEQALRAQGEWLDVSRVDLEAIVARTEQNALRRNFGAVTAGMVMARPGCFPGPAMPVDQALQRLSFGHYQALPVVDDEHRLLGMVGIGDLVDNERAPGGRGWPAPGEQQVADRMTAAGATVTTDTPLVDLVALINRQRLHCLPVVRGERVVGMVTQAEVIDGLHRELFAG